MVSTDSPGPPDLTADAGFLAAVTDLAGAETTAEVTGTVLDAIPAALGADLVALAILDDDRVRLAHRHGSRPGARAYAGPHLASELLNECIARGDLVEHRGNALPAAPASTSTAVAAPVVSPDGQIMGALAVGWSVEVEVDAATTTRLGMLARSCGAALERARRTGAHRDVVHQIQRELLPSPGSTDDLVVSTLYLPATVDLGFGGDWYDLITLDHDRHVALVGDVVGHGTAAAARMTQVRSALAALVHTDVDLPDLVTRATQVLQRMTGERDYIATATLVLVEPGRRRVTGITAGHPPPLVRLPDGTVRSLDGARSAPLGLRCSVPDAQVEDFPPGSTLLAYTDGLIERRDEPITTGIERLRRALARRAPVRGSDELEELVSAVLPVSPQRRDDVAVLAVHHRG